MTAFSAAAHDEGGDTTKALRARITELEDMLANLPLSSPQRLRARIQRLEEMLAAVGAGGVGPLMPVTVQHQREPSSDNDLPIENGQLITSCSTVPAGWKPVPLELTQAMLDQLRFGWSDISTAHVFDRWKRTVAAAPQPPVVGQSDNDTVPVPRSLLGAACAAINRKQDAPKLLEQLRRYTTGDLSTPAAAPQQGEQGPVAILAFYEGEREPRLLSWNQLPNGQHRLYTHQKPKRNPLTEDQIALCDASVRKRYGMYLGDFRDVLFARAIERAHGIEGQA